MENTHIPKISKNKAISVSNLDVLINENKQALLEVQGEVAELLNDTANLIVTKDNKEAYTGAVNAWKKIKKIHVAIEKKRKEIKAPFSEVIRELDSSAKGLINPLKNREIEIKEKCKIYEDEQQRIKEEKRVAELKEQQRIADLDKKISDFNSVFLDKILDSDSLDEIIKIENELNEVDINEQSFQEKSAEASFIRSQLIKKIAVQKERLVSSELATQAKKEEEEKQKQIEANALLKEKAKNYKSNAEVEIYKCKDLDSINEVIQKLSSVKITPETWGEYAEKLNADNLELIEIANSRKEELEISKNREEKLAKIEEEERIKKEQEEKKRLQEEKLNTITFKVMDISKVPKKYLLLNESLVQSDINSGKTKITGIKIGKLKDLNE